MRKSGSGGIHSTTKQKGKSRRGSQIGTYSKIKKSRKADVYDRPLLTGTYAKD